MHLVITKVHLHLDDSIRVAGSAALAAVAVTADAVLGPADIGTSPEEELPVHLAAIDVRIGIQNLVPGAVLTDAAGALFYEVNVEVGSH